MGFLTPKVSQVSAKGLSARDLVCTSPCIVTPFEVHPFLLRPISPKNPKSTPKPTKPNFLKFLGKFLVSISSILGTELARNVLSGPPNTSVLFMFDRFLGGVWRLTLVVESFQHFSNTKKHPKPRISPLNVGGLYKQSFYHTFRPPKMGFLTPKVSQASAKGLSAGDLVCTSHCIVTPFEVYPFLLRPISPKNPKSTPKTTLPNFFKFLGNFLVSISSILGNEFDRKVFSGS